MIRLAALLCVATLAAPLWGQPDVRPEARTEPAQAPKNDMAAGAGDMAAEIVISVQTPGPETVRPMARGSMAATLAGTDLRPVARPYERPLLAYGAQTLPIYRAEQGLFAFSPLALAISIRPDRRPQAIEVAAEQRQIARLRGQVCGDPAIQGSDIGFVSAPGACGIDNAVRITSVAGVTLSPRATMDCPTARALKTWVERGVIPAVGGEGGGVSALRVASHFSCRPRNNQAGARLSEHSFGRAIDIAGIRLRSGREMTVLTDWDSEEDGPQLRQMWRAACGPFGTVLGPESNAYHRDHFHFDTARYRSGSYCR